MSRGKKQRTPAEKAHRAALLKANQKARYQALLAERPNDPHRKVWEAYVK